MMDVAPQLSDEEPDRDAYVLRLPEQLARQTEAFVNQLLAEEAAVQGFMMIGGVGSMSGPTGANAS